MSINKAILVGNVGKDPDVRYIDNGTPVARFSLATSERGYTLPNGTQVPERSEWHSIVAWRGLAEIVEKYVRKGTLLYIEGKISYRSWTDKSGITRYATEIVAENLQLLSRKTEGQSTAETVNAPENSPAQESTTTPNTVKTDPSEPAPASADNVNDLPF